jgi:DNA-binding NarL/FixJ family response regulator
MATPVRILIADDHELVRQGVRVILSAEPSWIVCGEASTGRQALNMARDLKPDVIILDIRLPEMNGLEVTRRIRRTMDVPVLIVTVDDADQVVQEAVEAGASGYILKTDAGKNLADAVRTILRKGEFFSERVRAACSRGSGGPHRGAASERLTSREREVLPLVAEGLASKEIAGALGITRKTVETHRARIMMKLQLHSMSELVRYAIRNRFIEP